MFAASLGRMRKEIKQKIQVGTLSFIAALATAAGADAAVIEPPVTEPKPKPKPERTAPAIPQPEDGVIEGVSISTLETIAACESGGDPQAVNAAGYYGKYQFDLQTWSAVGGSGNPAQASEAEQDYRAALLYSQSGSSPWPVCGV